MIPDDDGSVCADHDKPHVLWYMLDDPNDPVPAPYSVSYDDQQDALDAAHVIIDKTMAYPERSALLWIKVFRADNEAYTCLVWHRPTTITPTPSYRPKPPERTMQNDLAGADTKGRSWWRRLLGR